MHASVYVCFCVRMYVYVCALLIFYVDCFLLSIDCWALVRQTAASAGIAIGSGRNGNRQATSPTSSTARRSHLIDSCLLVTSVKMTHRVLVTGKHKSQQTPTELEREPPSPPPLPQKKITTKQKNKAQAATQPQKKRARDDVWRPHRATLALWNQTLATLGQ